MRQSPMWEWETIYRSLSCAHGLLMMMIRYSKLCPVLVSSGSHWLIECIYCWHTPRGQTIISPAQDTPTTFVSSSLFIWRCAEGMSLAATIITQPYYDNNNKIINVFSNAVCGNISIRQRRRGDDDNIGRAWERRYQCDCLQQSSSSSFSLSSSSRAWCEDISRTQRNT